MKGCFCKLHVLPFGLALGVIWGVGLLLVGLISAAGGWGDHFIAAMASLYVGYDATILGSLVGFVWGFVDFLVFGLILAWLYNFFVCKCAKYCKGRVCGTGEGDKE